MTQIPPETRTGANFAAAALGEFANLDQYRFHHPALSFEVEGKVFLNSLLALTSTEISVNKLPPRASMPFHHRHRLNEEIYIFIKGTGEFQVDDDVFAVSEGTVVRVAPEGVRCWRNLSSEPLYYVVIQAPASGFHSGATIGDGVVVPAPARRSPR